jgi:oleate hydratase
MVAWALTTVVVAIRAGISRTSLASLRTSAFCGATGCSSTNPAISQKAHVGCTGCEIMTEVLGHLRIEAEAQRILETSICIPCMMSYITSQFLRHEKGDRPQVVPKGSRNLGFMCQFCELPDDVVFTVECSIRSAQTAVYALLGLRREPPAIYRGKFDPRVVYKAFLALHDISA